MLTVQPTRKWPRFLHGKEEYFANRTISINLRSPALYIEKRGTSQIELNIQISITHGQDNTVSINPNGSKPLLL